MQTVGRNLLRCAISNEANLYGSSRALSTAAPEKELKTKKEKKMNKKATHSLSYVQNMVRKNPNCSDSDIAQQWLHQV